MKLASITLHRLGMPLVRRFETSPGTGVTVREDLVREWALAAPVVLFRT